MEKVYTIIVTYNAMPWIDRCLGSLRLSTIPSHVVIVDNGSKDETVGFIREKYPEMELILSPRNLGFGQGNNLGIDRAVGMGANYFFLLNQDAYVESRTIEKLIDSLKSYPEFGLVSPVHMNGDGTDLDDHFQYYFLASDYTENEFRQIKQGVAVDRSINSPFVNAACWMVSSECIRKVGGFDPVFFHYGEDDNYGQRVLHKGYKIGICLGTVIFHDKMRSDPGTRIPVKRQIRKEWVQFLVYACDINRRNIYLFLFRRLLSYWANGILGLLSFNSRKAKISFALGMRLVKNVSGILKSRKLSGQSTPYTHLSGLHNLRPGADQLFALLFLLMPIIAIEFSFPA